MQSTARNARALKAAPILVFAFLMAGGGAAPAPKSIAPHPNAEQVLAGATAVPERATARPRLQAPALPSIPQSDRRVAEFTVDAIAEAAAEARREARAEAKAKARAAARAEARAEAKAEKKTQAAAPVYSGTNHFWIPSLGMSTNVHAYPCSRSRPPDNYMYRWGCAGQNNVYILGHAYSVMKPLHDLYVRGGLRKGMIAVYANGNGVVTKYRVTAWRVVDPVDSHWAIADQPRPSMTLQTCVGKKSQWRLNVRLVAVN
jgi:sortase (surface protein transpeptidase)